MRALLGSLLVALRYTMVFRNRNGKWLIVAHHSSEVL